MNEVIKCQLYLITPPKFDPIRFSERLKNALGAGTTACLQLRLKNALDDNIKKAAEMLLPICHEYKIPLIMNDRPDLALSTGCDGVHIGQDDASCKETRNLLGPDLTIGVTCKNSRHLAIEAVENGADYVAFGAFFPTDTKLGTETAELENIKWWNETTMVPSVAIGGIKIKNCIPLVEAGTSFLAVIGEIWDHSDGEAAAVIAFNKIFDRALSNSK
jgi:thiamine-phosphate pyrophosphorylase